MPLISETEAWKNLAQLGERVRAMTLGEMFLADPGRAATCVIDLDDLYIDYSRQRVTPEVLGALGVLAESAGLGTFLKRMMAGETVNVSEDRPALHTLTRGTECDDAAARRACDDADRALRDFVTGVHAGTLASASGAPFESVVAIGIGGSELGPVLALDALGDGLARKLDVRVCGNIDGTAFRRAFAGLDPATTLVVVISKSFRTMETQVNAEQARTWLRAALGEQWVHNVCAVSANTAEVARFGIGEDRTFAMWDWVGGRYSLCSAVGLPVALAFGWDVFAEIRAGAHDMDCHALAAPVPENAPAMLALLTLWNADFLGYGAEACVPYDTRLQHFVAYLQQLEMESNGKRVTGDGTAVDYATQPVVFGGVGLNAQHAFFQQLHQGTTAAPVDFLVPAHAPAGDESQHDLLLSAAVAQADALAFGRENAEEPHRHYPGTRPSTVIAYADLTPRMLGKLIALYEHKTVCAGALWGINPFDQWGVELGKSLTDSILPMMGDPDSAPASLQPLLGALQRMRKS